MNGGDERNGWVVCPLKNTIGQFAWTKNLLPLPISLSLSLSRSSRRRDKERVYIRTCKFLQKSPKSFEEKKKFLRFLIFGEKWSGGSYINLVRIAKYKETKLHDTRTWSVYNCGRIFIKLFLYVHIYKSTRFFEMNGILSHENSFHECLLVIAFILFADRPPLFSRFNNRGAFVRARCL